MLKQKVLVQFGSNIFLKIFGMAAGIIVARIAGPEVVGTLAYALAYVTIFSFITGIFGTPHIKLISEGRPLEKCMGTYAYLQGGSIIIYLILVLSVFFIQKHILHYEFESKVHEVVILIFIFIKIVDRLFNALETTFTARLELVKANYPKIIRAIIYHLGRVVIVLLGYKAIQLALWNLVSGIIVVPFIVSLFLKLPWKGCDKQLAKEYVKYAIPLILYMVIGILIAQSDKLMLQHFTNSRELGYYSAAFGLGGFILLIGNTMGQVFFPLFSKYISNNEWNLLNDKLSTFQEVVIVYLFPVVCVIALMAEPIITILLGEAYTKSITPFALLIVASFIVVLTLPYGNVITGKGKFYLYSLLTFFKFIFFIGSIFIFISPDFLGLGALGLAFNKVAVVLFEGILFFVAAKKIAKLKIDKSNIFSLVLVSIIATLFYLLINWSKEMFVLWWLILGPLFMIVSYGLLYIFGYLNKGNLNQMKEILNVGKLKKYIKTEIKDNNK